MVNCERVCLIFEQDDSSACGLLMSYGPDMPDYFRKAAGYADKMRMPVEQPARLKQVINLRGHRMKPPMSPFGPKHT